MRVPVKAVQSPVKTARAAVGVGAKPALLVAAKAARAAGEAAGSRQIARPRRRLSQVVESSGAVDNRASATVKKF